MPATQSSAAACQMSVPTIFAAVSGNATIITSPKNVPLPTEVSPTTKPPEAPRATAMILSRRASRKGSSVATTPRLMNVFATNPSAPRTSAPPISCARTSFRPEPYWFSR